MVVPSEYPLPLIPKFFSRYFISIGLDIESWENWFLEHGARILGWLVPCWGELLPILELGVCQYVWLVGLRQTSFYFPWCLLRQFGWEQIVPPPTLNFFPVEDLTERMLMRLGSLWENRRPLTRPSQSVSRVWHVSRDYMKWLWKKVVSKMLAVETGQRWFPISDTMEGHVVVFPKLVWAYRSMECLQHSIQAGEVGDPRMWVMVGLVPLAAE